MSDECDLVGDSTFSVLLQIEFDGPVTDVTLQPPPGRHYMSILLLI